MTCPYWAWCVALNPFTARSICARVAPIATSPIRAGNRAAGIFINCVSTCQNLLQAASTACLLAASVAAGSVAVWPAELGAGDVFEELLLCCVAGEEDLSLELPDVHATGVSRTATSVSVVPSFRVTPGTPHLRAEAGAPL